MTTDDSSSAPGDESEALAAAEDAYRAQVTDSVLSELVGISDDSDFSMAISLQVGGYLVGGVLVSVRDYFRGLAELVRGAGEDGASEALDAVAGLFDNLSEQQEARRSRRLQLLQDEQAALDPEDRVRPGYVHLRDAHLLGPAGELAAVPFWRGRLDHVDAFWLGSLSVRPPAR